MKKRDITDYHIHSEWSPDSHMSIQEALTFCYEHEIYHIAFTEHMDIGNQPMNRLFRLQEFARLAQTAKVTNSKMKILVGIEAGINVDNLCESEKFLDAMWFDYVIVSLHASEGKPFCSVKNHHKTGHELFIKKYFDEMLFMVTHMKRYHAVGHIDYLLRYQPYSLHEFLLFEKEIKAILHQVMNHNAALEINTKGIQSLQRPHPPLEILQWYKQMGGRLVVIGSDAHKATQIGEHFDSAIEWIKQAGYNHYNRFVNNQWQDISL